MLYYYSFFTHWRGSDASISSTRSRTRLYWVAQVAEFGQPETQLELKIQRNLPCLQRRTKMSVQDIQIYLFRYKMRQP